MSSKKAMAVQPRGIKQNRGPSGESVGTIERQSGRLCSTCGERPCADDAGLAVMEVLGNLAEKHA
eukprot:654478-Pyramimonas_sp.AAC.1